jgi:predicted lipid-binding transport protein (Tim44 family)
VIQLSERDLAKKKENAEKKAFSDEPVELSDKFAAMRKIDAQFTASEFLNGARAAYEMVLEAFNEGDEETLAMLLSKDVLREFKGTLAANAKAGRKAHTTLVAILKAEIADAKLRGNVATITVDFLSEQIPLVRDASGEIVEGNASYQEAVEDQWVFERNLAVSDPAWKVIET